LRKKVLKNKKNNSISTTNMEIIAVNFFFFNFFLFLIITLLIGQKKNGECGDGIVKCHSKEQNHFCGPGWVGEIKSGV
jgi:hypothetical protein